MKLVNSRASNPFPYFRNAKTRIMNSFFIAMFVLIGFKSYSNDTIYSDSIITIVDPDIYQINRNSHDWVIGEFICIINKDWVGRVLNIRIERRSETYRIVSNYRERNRFTMTYYISRFRYYDNDTISLKERQSRLTKEMSFYRTNYQIVPVRLTIEYLNSKGERDTIEKYIDLIGKKFEFSKFNVKNDTLYADSSIIITDPDQYYLKLEAISDKESKVIACGYYDIRNSVLNISEISSAGKNIGQFCFYENQPNKLFYEIEIGILNKSSKLDSLPKNVLNDTSFNNNFTSYFNVRLNPPKYSRETLNIYYKLGSSNYSNYYTFYIKHKMFYQDSYRYF